MIKAVIFDYGNVMKPESRCMRDIILAYKVSARIIKKKIIMSLNQIIETV